jgi:hypothetical protein
VTDGFCFRTIRGSLDAQHNDESFFIILVRPVIVELVKISRILNLI